MGELAFALGVAGAQPARPLPFAPGWTRAGAVLDADFAVGRYFFGGRETFAQADFLAACGGTGSGTQLTIGPFAAPTGETLPFAGFAPAGIAGVVDATTGASSGSSQVLWQLDDNAEEAGSPVERNLLRLSWDTDGHLHLVASTDAGGGTTATEADLDLGPVDPSSDFRVTFSAATGLFAASLNGAPAERQAGGRLAPSTIMRIGGGHVTGEEWAGTIGRITLFPATRDAEELENLAGDAAQAIVAWGDSLTAGSGSTGSSNGYVPQLAALFDPPRAVANEGVAGQNSTEIAGRSGARRARLSLGGGEAVRNLFPLSRNWFERLPENLVNNGVAIDLVGSGVDAEGQPFGDIRCHGTATAGYVDFAQQIYGASAGYAASGSLDWTATVDVELVGGTTANVTGLFISLIEGDSPGGYSSEHDAPVPLDGARHRVSVSASLTHPYVRATPLMTVDNGTAIDLTLRFYPGQLEQAAEASAQQLTPLDGAIPASHAWDFAGGIGDWYGRFGADYETSLAVSDGALVITTDGGSLRGAQVDLPDAIPAGIPVRLSFDCALSGGVTGIEAGLLDGHNGVFSSTPGNYGALGSGHHSLDFISGGTGTIGFLSSDETGGFSLDNIVLETAVPVTSASIDLLAASGGDAGTIPGFLCGVHGALFADDTGQAWFRRDRPGPATFCPADAAFVPDLGRTLRRRIAIIWAGRTNFTSPLTVKSDVAAMVGCLGHQHYLVLPIMPWTTDSDDDSATRDQLNADLAVTYGTHFLDVIGPLQAANDGSADDLSDVANGWTPRSLRFDHGHLNDAGYGVVAALVHGAIVALRW